MPFVEVDKARFREVKQPEEPRARFREIEPEPSIEKPPLLNREEAQDFRYRALNNAAFSQIYSAPFYSGVRDEKDLRRFSYGKEATPKTAWQKIKKGLEVGDVYEQIHGLEYQELIHGISPERTKRIQELHGKLPSPEEQLEILPKWTSAFQMYPLMQRGIERGVKIGAPVAAAAGLMAGAPAAGLMFGAGVGLGTLQHISEREAGAIWADIKDLKDEEGNPVHPQILRWTAAIGGLMSGSLELLQIGRIVKRFPGSERIIQRVFRKHITKAIADGSLRRLALRTAKTFGWDVTSQTGQELAQEATAMLADRVAGDLHEQLTGIGVDSLTIEEVKERFEQTTVASLWAFPVLMAPGTAIGVTREVLTRKTPGVPDQIISEREIPLEEREAEFEREEAELVKEEPEIPEIPKQAWQMSLEEFELTRQTIGVRLERGAQWGGPSNHKRIVKKRVEEGKAVSLESLEAYKDEPWAKEVLTGYQEALKGEPEEAPFSIAEFFPEVQKAQAIDESVAYMIWELESAKGLQRVKTAKGFATVTEYPAWFRDKKWTKREGNFSIAETEG